MIQELPKRHASLVPMKFKRFFESRNQKIRIFGPCEVTGKNYEIFVSVEGFFVYLQGFKSIQEALSGSSDEERDFIQTGISPEGRKIRITT
ncbi:MAG: hypothetical protein HQL15_02810 [Candidatus Omnitrophica bacterium]|nr:hypothetical protein [Candidatus Omnitrophota bacterium]